jgi:hypothetical protein
MKLELEAGTAREAEAKARMLAEEARCAHRRRPAL